MKKWVALFLIVSGIGAMLYPFIYHKVSSYQENQLLQKWESLQAEQGHEAELSEGSNVPNWQTAKHNYGKLTDIFRIGRTEQDENSRQTRANKAEYGDLLGTIVIDAIDLRLPILEGATLENMRVAAGHIIGTAALGTLGNSAVAAHRSRNYGSKFSRLNEVEKGDQVVVETDRGTFVYTVYDKFIVDPTNVSVLKGDGRHKMLTLITCFYHPPGRLIVQARVMTKKNEVQWVKIKKG